MQTTTRSAITLEVNGEAKTVHVATLAELIEHLQLGTSKCATALNGDFVAVDMRQDVQLNDGDKVEVLTARQGG
ncbi:MAG: sulfur carrier protein ThiS [Hyphomicrobiaceae bacterium]